MNDGRDAWARAGKGAPFEQPRIVGCNKGNETEGHAMSLIRKNGYAVSSRAGFSGALFSALMALALFDPGVATAQEGKQIYLERCECTGQRQRSWKSASDWKSTATCRLNSEITPHPFQNSPAGRNAGGLC